MVAMRINVALAKFFHTHIMGHQTNKGCQCFFFILILLPCPSAVSIAWTGSWTDGSATFRAPVLRICVSVPHEMLLFHAANVSTICLPMRNAPSSE